MENMGVECDIEATAAQSSDNSAHAALENGENIK
jgi:hypothetical protein